MIAHDEMLGIIATEAAEASEEAARNSRRWKVQQPERDRGWGECRVNYRHSAGPNAEGVTQCHFCGELFPGKLPVPALESTPHGDEPQTLAQVYRAACLDLDRTEPLFITSDGDWGYVLAPSGTEESPP